MEANEEYIDAERYQDELNALIEQKMHTINQSYIAGASPFDEMYDVLVTTIVAATNNYVALRVIEDMLTGGEQ